MKTVTGTIDTGPDKGKEITFSLGQDRKRVYADDGHLTYDHPETVMYLAHGCGLYLHEIRATLRPPRGPRKAKP